MKYLIPIFILVFLVVVYALFMPRDVKQRLRDAGVYKFAAAFVATWVGLIVAAIFLSNLNIKFF